MSSLINKAKEVAKDVLNNDKRENPHSSNSGPHSSNLMNQADPRIDSDRDNRNNPSSRVGGYGDDRTFGTSTTGGGNYVDNPHSTNAGPHSSNLANKVDPRVDSDRDGRTDLAARSDGYGSSQATHGSTGAGYSSTQPGISGGNTYSTTGGQYDDPRSTNVGPHSSNLMNKMDPRVDSDRDGRSDPSSRVGGHGNVQDNFGTTGTTGTGYGSNGAGYGAGYNNQGGTLDSTYDNSRSGNAGPHSSNLMNKMDPRVDSDRDGRNNPASNVGGYGQTQQGYSSGGAFAGSTAPGGHHGHQGHHGTPGSGDANRTAGPHDSNLLNKLDPRVDSDMDGGKTYGGDRTNY